MSRKNSKNKELNDTVNVLESSVVAMNYEIHRLSARMDLLAAAVAKIIGGLNSIPQSMPSITSEGESSDD